METTDLEKGRRITLRQRLGTVLMWAGIGTGAFGAIDSASLFCQYWATERNSEYYRFDRSKSPFYAASKKSVLYLTLLPFLAAGAGAMVKRQAEEDEKTQEQMVKRKWFLRNS